MLIYSYSQRHEHKYMSLFEIGNKYSLFSVNMLLTEFHKLTGSCLFGPILILQFSMTFSGDRREVNLGNSLAGESLAGILKYSKLMTVAKYSCHPLLPLPQPLKGGHSRLIVSEKQNRYIKALTVFKWHIFPTDYCSAPTNWCSEGHCV